MKQLTNPTNLEHLSTDKGEPIFKEENIGSLTHEVSTANPNNVALLPTKSKHSSTFNMTTTNISKPYSSASRKNSIQGTNPHVPQRRSARLNSFITYKTLEDIPTTEPHTKSRILPAGRERRIIHPISRKSSIACKPTDSIGFEGISGAVNNPVSYANPTTSRFNQSSYSCPLEDRVNCQLMAIFLALGDAYYHLRRFQPQLCLEALANLPSEQQATPWVISKIARAQYEMLSYKDSKSTFKVLRKIAPSWMEELEIYSTVLWHLNDDVMLAFHAHQLVDNNFLSPEAWCAVGNSFSLQKAHKDAIKCFRRATQLEPQLAHSYSLLGHEYLEMEEFDEAGTAFRQALQVDQRHYISWVGLGRIQEKLGKTGGAIKCYLHAEKLNPTNGVLLNQIAQVSISTYTRCF
jgi:anaphase-promoting complex subunit 3